MRWVALALLASGCNAAFGLDTTQLVDAGPRDAAIDAPRACPAIGTPLKFGSEFRQVIRQDCQGYNFSSVTNVGVASCMESPSYSSAPYHGTRDTTLTKIDIGLMYVDAVRLFPEGDRMIVSGYDASYGYKVGVYAPTGDGAWTPTTDSIPLTMTGDVISTFSSAPDRRVMMSSSYSPVVEWAQSEDGKWTMLGTYALDAWKCQYVNGISMTDDGLRVVVSCSRTDTYRIETRYAERATRGDSFGELMPIEGAPANLGLVVITDDCARAYFSALNAVFSADLVF